MEYEKNTHSIQKKSRKMENLKKKMQDKQESQNVVKKKIQNM